MARELKAAGHLNGFQYSGTEDLVRLEVMESYNRFIVELVLSASRKTGVNPKRVLDFGAGIGTLSIQFERATGVKPMAFEIDEKQAEIIRQRGYETFTHWEDVPANLDCIFASNVLEHIREDRVIVDEFRSRLRPGGCLFLLVPAFTLLWTEMDDQVGHFRRYTRSTLSKVLHQCGMKVVESKYCDSLGFFAIAFLKLCGSRRSAETADSLRFYDRRVLPFSRGLDRLGLQFLCGRNVYVAAITE